MTAGAGAGAVGWRLSDDGEAAATGAPGTKRTATPPEPPAALVAAYEIEALTVARYDAFVRTTRATPLVTSIVKSHNRHLDALAAAILAVAPQWQPTPATAPRQAGLGVLERRASAAFVALLPDVDGDGAGLLASIAAAEAAHAELLRPGGAA